MHLIQSILMTLMMLAGTACLVGFVAVGSRTPARTPARKNTHAKEPVREMQAADFGAEDEKTEPSVALGVLGVEPMQALPLEMPTLEAVAPSLEDAPESEKELPFEFSDRR